MMDVSSLAYPLAYPHDGLDALLPRRHMLLHGCMYASTRGASVCRAFAPQEKQRRKIKFMMVKEERSRKKETDAQEKEKRKEERLRKLELDRERRKKEKIEESARRRVRTSTRLRTASTHRGTPTLFTMRMIRAFV